MRQGYQRDLTVPGCRREGCPHRSRGQRILADQGVDVRIVAYARVGLTQRDGCADLLREYGLNRVAQNGHGRMPDALRWELQELRRRGNWVTEVDIELELDLGRRDTAVHANARTSVPILLSDGLCVLSVPGRYSTPSSSLSLITAISCTRLTT